MAGEHVILLDKQGQPAGMLERYTAHTLDTPLHLALSCWLFNRQGQFLVTRRLLGKKAWPGVWTNSVYGHPQQGGTFKQAVARHCRSELGVGIADIAPVHPAFRYRAVAPNGIVENEVCPVYAARVISQVQPNDDEVMDYRWVDLETVLNTLATTPWASSPWMILEAENRGTRQALIDFVARLREQADCSPDQARPCACH